MMYNGENIEVWKKSAREKLSELLGMDKFCKVNADFDIEYEKNKKLTTEQVAMILDLAAQAASDGGFVSSYIFYRAAYVFAAQVLYPAKKDTIASTIGNGYDIRLAFDLLVQDGTLEDMQTKYKMDLEELDKSAEIWCQEVADYQQSARGILDTVNTLSGDIVKSATEQLQKAANGDVKIIQDFADKWGFDRPTPGEDNVIDPKEIQESFKVMQGNKQ